MNKIRLLNKYLKSKYPNATNIRHYTGNGYNDSETHLTTSKIPNTNKSGRIFVGYTGELLREIEKL